jgi:hypothetical protein
MSDFDSSDVEDGSEQFETDDHLTSSTQRFGGIDSKSNDDKLKLVDQILKSSGVNNASYKSSKRSKME